MTQWTQPLTLNGHFNKIAEDFEKSFDPELMVRMLLIGYCLIRSERRLCREAELNLAYRWFCRLGLEDKVAHHSTFSVNRHGRFCDRDVLRKVFDALYGADHRAAGVKPPS